MDTFTNKTQQSRLGPRLIRWTGLIVCMVWSLSTTTTVLAQSLDGTDASNSFFAQPASISLKQATKIAKEHTGGRVLSASPKRRGEQVEYRVRMLVNGERVRTVVVDGRGNVVSRR